MPYPTEWPEQWAIRPARYGGFDPNGTMPDGNEDPAWHQEWTLTRQRQEAQGRILFDDVTLEGERLEHARLQRLGEPRTIDWIQLYRSRNFVPLLDLVQGQARRRFIAALTEFERNTLSGTSWEPIIRDQWQPAVPINYASMLWTIFSPLPGDSTGSIPWFETFIYHFQIVPRRFHSR